MAVAWLFFAGWIRQVNWLFNPAFMQLYKAVDHWSVLGIRTIPNKLPIIRNNAAGASGRSSRLRFAPETSLSVLALWTTAFFVARQFNNCHKPCVARSRSSLQIIPHTILLGLISQRILSRSFSWVLWRDLTENQLVRGVVRLLPKLVSKNQGTSCG